MNPQEPTQPKKFKRIPEYDGLRAIAVSLVFLYHFNEELFYFGWCGVDIFFAISGFVITLQCYSLREKLNNRQAIREFFIRRVTRIFPLYYFLLLMLFIASLCIPYLSEIVDIFDSLPKDVTDPTLWKNAVFLTNFYIFFEGYDSVSYGITWSLAVEEHFYLIYPFIYFFLPKNKYLTVILTSVFLVFFLRLYLSLSLEKPGRLYFLTFSRIDAILFGCIAAQFIYHPLKRFALATVATTLFLGSIAFLAIYHHNDLPQIIIGYTIIPAATALIMLIISNNAHPILSLLLANRPMVLIGSVSYGFYLIHVWVVNGVHSTGLILKLANILGPTISQFVVGVSEFLIILLLAYISFHFFETPARKLLAGVFNKKNTKLS